MQEKKDENFDLYKKMKELVSPPIVGGKTLNKMIPLKKQNYEILAPVIDHSESNEQQKPSTFHLQGRLSRDELKSQINTKNKALQELHLNRDFFEKELANKIERFKEDLKEIKPQVFDKTFKSNLHYIYKHYENFKNEMSPHRAREILEANLTKQHKETRELREKNQELGNRNRIFEQQLINMATHEGIIKKNCNVVDKMTKQEIEVQIKMVEKDNLEFEKKLSEIKKNRDSELMKLQMRMEQKGRKGMEKRAVKLALMHTNEEDFDLAHLKNHVSISLERIEDLKNIRRRHTYFQLDKKRKQLLEKINNLRIVS